MRKIDDDDYPILEAIRDLCGPAVAKEVQTHFAGTRVTIPHPEDLRADRVIVQKLGWATAEKLSKQVGFFRGAIPMEDTRGLNELRANQTADVEDMIRAKRLKMHEIAHAIGVHERTVWRTRARIKNEERPDVISMLRRGRTVADIAQFTIITEKEIVKIRRELVADGKLRPDARASA